MNTNKNSSINIRVEDKLKEDAQEIFNELGLSMSSAITLFLTISIREGGIPFSLKLED